jgi:hypothetical protein
MIALRLGVLVAFIWATGCGGYWRQPAVQQEPWVPTMSEQSNPRAGGKGHAGGDTAGSTTSRLEELNALHDRGLVTDSEYRQKRQQIIDGL